MIIVWKSPVRGVRGNIEWKLGSNESERAGTGPTDEMFGRRFGQQTEEGENEKGEQREECLIRRLVAWVACIDKGK